MVRRGLALFSALVVMVVASIAWAVAAPSGAYATPNKAPGGACSIEEWQGDFRQCVSRLESVGEKASCQSAQPTTPDSGLAGWFAERPEASNEPGPQGMYTLYGYAGYSFPNYDQEAGCAAQ